MTPVRSSNQGMYFRRPTIDDIPPASYLDEGPEDEPSGYTIQFHLFYCCDSDVFKHISTLPIH